MVWLRVGARVAIRMELRGQQDVEVSGREANPELTSGRSFMGSKMLGWFCWRYRSRFMRWSGWKEMPELSTGWSFKVNKTVKWLGWNEWPEIPPGWIFKISKMLWGSGWKERQELPLGWSFKGRRMPRWSEGKERPKLHLGLRLEAGKMLSAWWMRWIRLSLGWWRMMLLL